MDKTNLLYMKLYRSGKQNEFTFRDASSVKKSDINRFDLEIVKTFEYHETHDLIGNWENSKTDYETAFDALIELMEEYDEYGNRRMVRPEQVRWCDHCGMPMRSGYYIAGQYACCDKCRDEIYRKDYGLQTSEEAYAKYLEEANDDDYEVYYTEW